MSDARQRLLDALAEVTDLTEEIEAMDSALISRLMDGETRARITQQVGDARKKRAAAIYALLPTLAALREVVEMHGWDVDALRDGEVCRHCDHDWPCPTLSTLTRQFEED